MLNTIINNVLKTRNGLRFILIQGDNKSAVDAINETIAFLSYEVQFHSEPYPIIVGRDEDGYPIEEWRNSWFEELLNGGCTEEQAIERIITTRINSVLYYREHRFDEVPQLSPAPCAPIDVERYLEDESLPF